jgi:hypothetical protein
LANSDRFFGLGTGYFIWGGQALFDYPKASPEVDRTMGMLGFWMPGFCQFLTGVYLIVGLTQAVPDALVGVANAEQKEPPGFWGVLKIFRSENLRRGLAVVNNLLEAWGRNFSTQKKP